MNSKKRKIRKRVGTFTYKNGKQYELVYSYRFSDEKSSHNPVQTLIKR